MPLSGRQNKPRMVSASTQDNVFQHIPEAKVKTKVPASDLRRASLLCHHTVHTAETYTDEDVPTLYLHWAEKHRPSP